MHTERLTKLAELLEQYSRRKGVKFDLESWYVRSECGTSACAIGLACMDPWFQDQGLRLSSFGPGESRAQPSLGRGRVWYGWSAVKPFFGIDQKTAEWLFSQRSYPNFGANTTPKRVAARIRKILESENADSARH